MEVMHLKSITPTIRRQIGNYVLIDNMTYKDIASCIVWYDEVFHGKFGPSVGDRAAEYFRNLEKEKKAQQEQARKVAEYQENNIIFNIKSLEHKKRTPKQLDISEINVEGESDDD